MTDGFMIFLNIWGMICLLPILILVGKSLFAYKGEYNYVTGCIIGIFIMGTALAYCIFNLIKLIG